MHTQCARLHSMKYLKQSITTIYIALCTVPFMTYAECDPGKLCNPLKGDMGLWDLVEFLIRDVLVEIIAPIAITLALLWSGFQFITAQGKEAELAKARNNFFMVIIGAVILLGAYVILEIVTSTVNDIVG